MGGCPANFIVDACCALVHSGHNITVQQVESCYIARKHEVSENNIGAFIEMVKEFAAIDAAAEADGHGYQADT